MIALLLLLQAEPNQIGTTSTEFSSRVMAIAVSPDGRSLVLGRQSGAVELWDLATRARSRVLLAAHNENYGPTPDAALFHPDGKSVFVAGGLFGVRRWSTEDGAAMIWQQKEAKDPLALSPDAKVLAFGVGYQGGLTLWNLAAGRRENAFEGHKLGLRSLSFSPDGKRLYSASQDLTTRAWDVASGKELWRLGNETDERSIGPAFPHCLSISPDGRRLAISYHGCWELGLEFVDTDTGMVVAKGEIGNSDAIVFHPKKGLLALQGRDGHLYLWDVEKGCRVSKSPAPHKGRVFAMAFTPDGGRLLSAGDHSVLLLWDPAAFTPVK